MIKSKIQDSGYLVREMFRHRYPDDVTLTRWLLFYFLKESDLKANMAKIIRFDKAEWWNNT